MTKNPYKPGDVVRIKRGDAWLTGTVVKTILARCHIQIGERVFVENWHDCRNVDTEWHRKNTLTQQR